LRRDALVLFEDEVQERRTWSERTPAGTYWMHVTFFDPAIDNDPRDLETDDVYHNDHLYHLYQSMALGGVRAYWTSKQAYRDGEPGVVEYIAAGSGFGPDILEESANIIGRPLKLGRGWNPAIVLFDRYGGTVHPRQASTRAGVVHDDVRYAPGIGAVKSAASDAFNEGVLSAGILPRYQKDDDRYLEDTAKLDADAAR
jgi:hypothetical protein